MRKFNSILNEALTDLGANKLEKEILIENILNQYLSIKNQEAGLRNSAEDFNRQANEIANRSSVLLELLNKLTVEVPVSEEGNENET